MRANSPSWEQSSDANKLLCLSGGTWYIRYAFSYKRAESLHEIEAGTKMRKCHRGRRSSDAVDSINFQLSKPKYVLPYHVREENIVMKITI